MDDILKEFLTESGENLDHVERDLVALEETPDSPALIAAIFRNIHTIKGSSGFLGLPRLEALAHGGESLLSSLREGRLRLDAAITDGLLRLVDALHRMLAHLGEHGTETSENFDALAAELARLATATPAKVGPGPATPAVETPPPDPGPTSASPAEGNIRVDVGLLDRLMNLVGELVLARNQINQLTATADDARIVAAAQRLGNVTTELQGEVMKTRLQPIGNVFGKFPRIVRDLAQELGKRVRLDLEGGETELDRSILEAIKDPLTHVVRNAVDHGIETPERRLAAGKPAEGVLAMRAFHEAGQVIVEIRDDGRGIDAGRVKAKALERGLLSAEQAARLSDDEACQLVFHPGLSTAERVTNISGRGVGMDVVRTNIERIGGAIDLRSEPGRGAHLRITIPLTLAIIPAILVESAGQRFAIPQVDLLELVRLEGPEAASGVETILGTPVHRLRDRLLPLVRLTATLSLDAPPPGEDVVTIVVLRAGGREFGLIVDRVGDPQEIVVKPLGARLATPPVFAGATILGDGRVALILDVTGLATRAGLAARTAPEPATPRAPESAPAGGLRRLLVFATGPDARASIDLANVGRLEKVDRSRIERAGDREVIQYRDDVMELVRLDALFGTAPAAVDDESLEVVVHTAGGRSLGLVVGRILDIVEERLRLHGDGARRGVLGTAVIQGRVTELLDLDAIVRDLAPPLVAGAGGRR